MDNSKVSSWTVAVGVWKGVMLVLLTLLIAVPVILFILAALGIALFI